MGLMSSSAMLWGNRLPEGPYWPRLRCSHSNCIAAYNHRLSCTATPAGIADSVQQSSQWLNPQAALISTLPVWLCGGAVGFA